MQNILLLTTALLVPATASIGTLAICYKPIENIKQSEVHCLSVLIYGEARGEPEVGQVAVAYTVLNRAVNKTLCQVALAPKQYSIFNNNPELRAAATSLHIEPEQKNIIDQQSWDQSVKVAHMVMQQLVKDPTNGATHYVAYKSLNRIPGWTKKLTTVAEIGNHTFFKDISRVKKSRPTT